ncbi:MAG TPA: type II secretion system protein GspK [Myxococcota bacterium]|nr:type II secretion system protein GspK [Myxococcota bacterium]HOS61709.1 type II secretion system protein GspK [Myxococcota bacterium]HPL24751.1 type II secretion system protein GspK [Myxococcota bacterium]HQE73164.1 type II secretion system protein GspK [Myxococcota bacterium]HQI61090.1 type II secretion system protein GspK [Myxococcota bacterium]
MKRVVDKKGPASNFKGVALIVVLAGITVLAAFSSEFTYRSRVDIKVASNVERQVQAYFHARSAAEIARLIISSQKMVDQAVAAFMGRGRAPQLWMFAGKFAEIFASSSLNFLGMDVMNLRGAEGLGVQVGGFDLKVESEDSRIGINAAGSDAALFGRLYPLFAGEVDPDSRRTEMDRKAADLVLNIMDWIDADDNRSDIDSMGNFIQAGGAGENIDYSKYGYRARNAKMDTVEELRLVEGMTDELFCKFGDELTVYQTDKVNINEASTQLIKALVCDSIIGDRTLACGYGLDYSDAPVDRALALMDLCRDIKRALFMPPFSNEVDFIGFWTRLPDPLNQFIVVDQNRLRPMVGTRTKVLRITARGWAGASGHQITAVIDQGSENFLYWKESGFDAGGMKDLGIETQVAQEIP